MRPEEEISLSDIIALFQGEFGWTHCVNQDELCMEMKHCRMRVKIGELEKIVRDELEKTSIAALI